MERNIECCECGQVFRCVGNGNYVTCPNCGVELQIGGSYDNSDDLETDYYDEDMEGAPGYYGGDF